MNTLCVDTSTSHAVIGLYQNQKVFERISTFSRTHTEFINQAFQEILEESDSKIADIDLFVLGKGPGSFTGVRVAGNFVKTLSFLIKKPFLQLNTLDILASQTEDPCLVIINAYKNLVYTGLFSKGFSLLNPAAVPVHQLENILNNANLSQVLCLGDGYNIYQPYMSEALKTRLIRKQLFSDFPKSSFLFDLSKKRAKTDWTLEWNLYSPLYIRASEAEENLVLKS